MKRCEGMDGGRRDKRRVSIDFSQPGIDLFSPVPAFALLRGRNRFGSWASTGNLSPPITEGYPIAVSPKGNATQGM